MCPLVDKLVFAMPRLRHPGISTAGTTTQHLWDSRMALSIAKALPSDVIEAFLRQAKYTSCMKHYYPLSDMVELTLGRVDMTTTSSLSLLYACLFHSERQSSMLLIVFIAVFRSTGIGPRTLCECWMKHNFSNYSFLLQPRCTAIAILFGVVGYLLAIGLNFQPDFFPLSWAVPSCVLVCSVSALTLLSPFS
jgi:hypothetical protein